MAGMRLDDRARRAGSGRPARANYHSSPRSVTAARLPAVGEAAEEVRANAEEAVRKVPGISAAPGGPRKGSFNVT